MRSERPERDAYLGSPEFLIVGVVKRFIFAVVSAGSGLVAGMNAAFLTATIIAVAAVWAFILVWGDYLTQDLFFLLDPNGTLLTRITDVLPSDTGEVPSVIRNRSG